MAEVWAGVKTPDYVRSPEELIGLCHLLHAWWKAQEGGKVIQASKGFSCHTVGF